MRTSNRLFRRCLLLGVLGLMSMVGFAASKQQLTFVSSTDPGNSSGETAAKLFDGTTDTKFCSKSSDFYMTSTPIVIQFKTMMTVTPSYYCFWTGNDTQKYWGRNPYHWKLRGKMADGTWVDIDERNYQYVTQSNKSRSDSYVISVDKRGCYDTYEFIIYRGRSNGDNEKVQLSEFELYGNLCNEEDAPQVMSVNFATPNQGNDYPGYMMLTWMSPKKVESVDLYTSNNTRLTYPTVVKPTESNSDNTGVLYLKADETARNLTLKVLVNYGEGSLDQRVNSATVHVPAYHIPNHMKVKWYQDMDQHGLRTGPVQIDWQITNPGVMDVMEGDLFLVERDTLEDFSTAQTIGMVPMQIGDTFYTYVDDTPEIQRHANEKYYYRVRRASTSVWTGSNLNPLSATQTLVVDAQTAPYQVALNGYDNNTATPYSDWATSRRVRINARSGQVSSNYKSYYWDKETMQAFLIRYMMRDGDTTSVQIPIPADSVSFVGNSGTDYSGYYNVTFTDELDAPCTEYKYAIKLDRSQSLLPILDARDAEESPLKAKTNFYYNDGMHLTSLEVSDRVSPDFNALVWETVGGFQYYEVWRNNTGLVPTQGQWELIASVKALSYIDHAAPIGRRCLYKVVGVQECGKMVRDSLYGEGYRDCYGSVSGNVMFPNGAANAGVRVEVTDLQGNLLRTTTTNKEGAYTVDSLYFQESDTVYFVSVRDDRNSVFHTAAGSPGRTAISLSGTTAVISNINFINTSFVRYEGRVLYEYSTLPVPHTQFVVNGQLLLNSSGEPYETDASGNFELMIPSGLTTVQAVKKGHTFENDGYFVDEEGQSEMLIKENVYSQRIYDLTKVRLIGRLTGGLDEGQKKLGFGKSVNTLGDNLSLVLELEGDNISHFVYHPTDLSITEHDTAFYHIEQGDSTAMHMTTKRITIYPDVRTGEYQVDIFPVKYKIVQATATGYSTLLPSGTAMPTLDLTDVINTPHTIHDTLYVEKEAIDRTLTYHETYSITYRTPIELTAEQLIYGISKDYYGEKMMLASNWTGVDTYINILRSDEEGHTTGYLFGYPVFSTEKEYVLSVSAREHYYYNGDVNAVKQWHVDIKEGDITVFNGLKTKMETLISPIEPVTHKALFNIGVDNASFVLQGESALRQVELRMNVNGQYIYGKPIKGYVSGTRSKGKDAVCAIGQEIKVLDYLRDPYGAYSYSYIEKGTTYDANYTSHSKYKAGINLKLTTGTNSSSSMGTVAAPMGAGGYMGTVTVQTNVETATELPIDGILEMYKNARYTFTTSENIQTSSDPTMVGSDADIYIGTTRNVCAGLCDAVALIDSAMYRMMEPSFQSGKMHLLAEPDDDSPYYLVVGEQVSVGTTYPVRFAYSQHYILNMLLPKLVQGRNALLEMDDPYALQMQANASGKPRYGSTVPVDDEHFGLSGYYHVYYPPFYSMADEVALYNRSIVDWQNVIMENERQKAEAKTKGKLFNTYALDAGSTISYSETGEHESASDWHIRWKDMLIDFGAGVGKTGWAAFSAWLSEGKEPSKDLEFSLFGTKFTFKYNVIWESTGDGMRDVLTKGGSKTTGFVLATGDQSYEDISVYRLTDESFKKEAKDDYDQAHDDVSNSKKDKDAVLADFVFLRTGGATRCPYEPGDSTIYYSLGGRPFAMAVPTVPIDLPTIQINTREISNVPQDQPATFVLTLSNESGVTYGSEWVPTIFTLKLKENSNPNGLIIKMDGLPIKNGAFFRLTPGESIQKTIQVYRGTAYDYEDVELIFQSDCDLTTYASTLFSVHYQQNSCPVTLNLPVQNWVMNTLSPMDEKGYYLPVEITDFDVNYDGFDHIDLQYKLHTQSDDQWVTQCSYFADSAIYNIASGNKAMIVNGEIKNVKFYGERDPMEQKYDLRAVSYCRFGNGFLSRSSELKSGLKDTRVPQLFGVAQPARGILQVGDYISIPFSEPIAANYLDEDFNFEITGYTNASGITSSTSLYFSGTEDSRAVTQVRRNLSSRDFTVEMQIMPDDDKSNMCYFAHGSEDFYMTFGQEYANGELHLITRMGDKTTEGYCVSAPIELSTRTWTHVAMVYNHVDGYIEYYVNGELMTGKQTLGHPCPAEYAGMGKFCLGNGPYDNEPYKGHMLEARLWNKGLNRNEINAYRTMQLTGYETGLMDYYPLNEGKGNHAFDKSGGATLDLSGLNWTHPEGKALTLKNQTLRLAGEHFPSDLYTDFTFTMWFRVEKSSASVPLLDSKGLGLTLSQSSITLHGLSHNVTVNGSWMDNDWHYVAISSNHSTGVGLLYLDGQMLAQVPADDYMGPADSELRVGPMTGSIDDITYWSMALPGNYLTEFYQHTPNNREMGLLTHIAFSERVLSDNGGQYTTKFCPYNLREKYDDLGNLLPRKTADRVIKNDDAEFADNMVDNAPIREKGNLVKLGFNWIGRDNELVINLKATDTEINKQNVFVTVRGVEDLAGNPQKNPMTWTLFVDRNRLRWSSKYLETTVLYGNSTGMSLNIINQGGTAANYYITELPDWLEVSSERGELAALDEAPITLRVSDKLDPGEYHALIYLVDDDGLAEPLRINVTVQAKTPDWQAAEGAGNGQTMGLFGRIYIPGARDVNYIDTDTADIVAAFMGNYCLGVEHISMQLEQSILYMTFHDINELLFKYELLRETPIRLLLWRASTGQIYLLNTMDNTEIHFEGNTVLGTPDEPVKLLASDYRTQLVSLTAGWNWISFFLDPHKGGTDFTGSLLYDYQFTEGDLIKSQDKVETYEGGIWAGLPLYFDTENIFLMRVAHDGQMGVHGMSLTDAQRKVNLHAGWNYLPYLCENIQPLNMALADYQDAQPGDIVKSYTEFAMLDSRGHWVGSLTHMQPGKGYMLYRQSTEPTYMQYQTLSSSPANVQENISEPGFNGYYSHNMPIVATVAGAMEGDILRAMDGTKQVGMAVADAEGRFMLLTSAQEGVMLSFLYENAMGQQSSAPVVRYRSAAKGEGTVEDPLVIDFETAMSSAYPNPFTDHICFSATGQPSETFSVMLLDVSSNLLWQCHGVLDESGQWNYQLNHADQYPQGVYMAIIRVGDKSTHVKLIKQ